MVEFLRSLVILSAVYSWSLQFCYFGDKVTTAFDDLNETIYQCDWYLFPMEMRKYIPAILRMAQEPVQMHAFGTYHCTLETLKTVRIPTEFEN